MELGVEEIRIIEDKITKKAKGFGYAKFSHIESSTKALKEVCFFSFFISFF